MNGAKIKRGIWQTTILFLLYLFMLAALILSTTIISTAKNKGGNMSHQNRLKDEKSPYLLQHADNPVDWYPWGDEAFEKAKKEDKPILLSIGYSTCHWCHVMEHESFEDPEVAKLMNDTFISIKVDREERPDIDNVYMTVCQMISKGNCGWPLNVIMTPDKKPFFAATYIPKESRFGRSGMMDLVPRVGEVWQKDRAEILKSADSITAALTRSTDITKMQSEEELGKSTLNVAYNQLLERYDEQNGGFGQAPKFPTPHNHLFLLRYWRRTGDNQALGMVENTLKKMKNGGIYDHIGFGFHRYSTDPTWFLPHFEKMLYDQAMLSVAYLEAFQITGNKDFAQAAREIFTYVLRDMTSVKGGFYSAEDADSEGEEGKFYTWTEQEIREVLEGDDAELMITVFNVEKEGNFSDEATGHKSPTNILNLRSSTDELAKSFGLTTDQFLKRIEDCRKKLFNHREKRIHPYKDDKILTDWNGLMIAALAKGGQVLSDKTYLNASKKAADFILSTMRKNDGRLLHRYREGDAAIEGNLDDYAFTVWGLLELYEATFDAKYLSAAIELNKTMIDGFWDDEHGGFYFTPTDGEQLIVRQKEIYDGAVPSGNSVAMLNLLRLGRITADSSLESKAAKLAKAFSPGVKQAPIAYTQLMSALDFAIGPSFEIIIAGDPNSDDTLSMIEALRNEYIPSKIVLLHDETNGDEITKIAPYTKGQKSLGGKATAYVCQNYECQLPTTDTKKMVEILRSESETAN